MPDIVFMGTPEFSIPAMEQLLKAGIRISLLICQPDKRKGRGKKMQFPPTKKFALKNNIDVFQPAKIRVPEVVAEINSRRPDFLVVIAYGRILPQSILELPRKGCINVHASLLPKWRGAAPIQFALLNGDRQTGVCTMLMDEGMDTGDILLSRKTEIRPDEMVDRLSARLAAMGGELIVETIQQFDQIKPVVQDHEKATYARLLHKEDRIIDWKKEAEEIERQFRALTPSPGMFTWFRAKRLLIKSMQVAVDSGPCKVQSPGVIVSIAKKSISVSCGKGVISILGCQPENKNAISAADFVNGYQVTLHEILGDNS